MNNNILNQVSSAAVPQQSALGSAYSAQLMPGSVSAAPSGNTTDYMTSARNTAIRDIGIIDNFMKAGLINPVQGQHLMNYVLSKAREFIVKQQQMGAVPCCQCGLADRPRAVHGECPLGKYAQTAFWRRSYGQSGNR